MDASRIEISGPLAPYIRSLWSYVRAQGYTELSTANVARLMAHLSRWMEKKGLSPRCFGVVHREEFLRHRRQNGYTHHLTPRALGIITNYLQQAGILPRFKAQPTQRRQGPFCTLVTEYSTYLEKERQLGKRTRTQYIKTAEAFLAYSGGGRQFSLKSLPAVKVSNFILRVFRRYGAVRSKGMGSALRSFLRYLFAHGYTAINLSLAVPAVAGWRLSGIPKVLPCGALELLLRSCDRRTHGGRRSYAILLLLGRLGLRAGEVAAIEVKDINWRQGILTVRGGKGGGFQMLPLPKDVGEAIARYLTCSRPRIGSRKVFASIRAPHRPLSVEGVKHVVASSCKRAGIAPVGSHQLRHTAASKMLRAGASLAEVAQVLRHAHIDTTAIYAKIDYKRLRELALPWPGGVA